MSELDLFDFLLKIDPTPGITNRIIKKNNNYIIPGWLYGINGFVIKNKISKIKIKEVIIPSQIIYDVLILGLTNIKNRPKCPICGKELDYLGGLSGYKKTCSIKCKNKFTSIQVKIYGEILIIGQLK